MSITTYKLEVLIGGHYSNSPEEMFIQMRDALHECGIYIQSLHLDAHYEDCRISQMPEGGMFSDESIRVEPLGPALASDHMFDGLFKKDSIIQENGKSEQTRTDPHDAADDSQPVG